MLSEKMLMLIMTCRLCEAWQEFIVTGCVCRALIGTELGLGVERPFVEHCNDLGSTAVQTLVKLLRDRVSTLKPELKMKGFKNDIRLKVILNYTGLVVFLSCIQQCVSFVKISVYAELKYIVHICSYFADILVLYE